MKKIISVLLFMAMLFCCLPPVMSAADYSSDFEDVDIGSWYYRAVSYCKQNGIFNGTGENRFSPSSDITRAEFVTALANFSGENISECEYDGFTDISKTAYYYHAMSWAKLKGIVAGTSNTTFSPGKKITRQELCVLIASYVKYKGIDTSVSQKELFADDASIPEWAYDAVYFIKDCGIIVGKGNGVFDPAGLTSRAESAQLMMKFEEYYIEEQNKVLGLKNSVVDIKIDGLKTNTRFLHLSDLHLTLWDETDSSNAIAEESARKQLFDSETPDGVAREDRLQSFYKLADEAKCKGVLMTGDIIDAPTNGNLSFLSQMTSSSPIKTFFCLGNHDWTFTENYQSTAQRNENIPKFESIFGADSDEEFWDSNINVKQFDGFVLVYVDNSNNQVGPEAYSMVKYYGDRNIPVVLMMHVPVYTETMENDVKSMWGSVICMGSADTSPNTTTQKFVNYLKSEESSVAAIITGHVHMDHIDRISDKNDTVQYTLGASYKGFSRIINIHG